MKKGDKFKIIMPEECNPNKPIEHFKTIWEYFKELEAVHKIFYWDVSDALKNAGIDFQYLWLSGRNEFIVDRELESGVIARLKGKRRDKSFFIDRRQFFRLEKM